MTSDLERLLATGDSEREFSRELLASLERAEPPAGAREMAWNGITRQIAFVGAASVGVSAAAGSASATQGATLFGSKAMLLLKIVAGVGAVSAGVAFVGSRTEPPALPVEPKPAASVAPRPALPRSEPRASVPQEVVACLGSECETAKPTRDGAARPSSDAERADRLSRESALLVKARAALRTGNVAEASALLTRLETQFPRGVLAQEREVLRIELLHARGDRAAAAARARAFIAANPKSPHSAKLSRFSSAR